MPKRKKSFAAKSDEVKAPETTSPALRFEPAVPILSSLPPAVTFQVCAGRVPGPAMAIAHNLDAEVKLSPDEWRHAAEHLAATFAILPAPACGHAMWALFGRCQQDGLRMIQSVDTPAKRGEVRTWLNEHPLHEGLVDVPRRDVIDAIVVAFFPFDTLEAP
jgi:hypothetical protein